MAGELEFTWKREGGSTGNGKYRVRKAQFGDGYKQHVPDGLNNKMQKWPVSFSGDLLYISPIQAFLDLHAGATAFKWTPPGSPQSLFTAEEYQLTSIGAGVFQLSTTFESFFKP